MKASRVNIDDLRQRMRIQLCLLAIRIGSVFTGTYYH